MSYQLITSYPQLVNFFALGQQKDVDFGLYVSTAIRRESFLSESQCKVARKGIVWQINFKAMGGGVWHATLKKLERTQ